MTAKEKTALRKASPYNASITREQFLFYEMRTTAKLVCEGLGKKEIVERIMSENLFQYPTERSIKSIANACVRRLDSLQDASLVKAIAEAPSDVAKQVCLYAMMRQYRLVWDFMGAGGMSAPLVKYVKEYYPDSKSDLFAVFIERINNMISLYGFQAMITQHAWMFLSSFEQLRLKILKRDIINMAHLGSRAFEEIGGEVVQTTAFVLRNRYVRGYKGTYCRLLAATSQQEKEQLFLLKNNNYMSRQDDQSMVPGNPIAYWATNNDVKLFNNKPLEFFVKCCKELDSGDNNRFLRIWSEVSFKRITFDTKTGKNIIWCPHIKGGGFRRWYGNYEYILWWKNDGIDIKNHPASRQQSLQYSFKTGFTWSNISTGSFAARYIDGSCSFDSTGPMGIVSGQSAYYYVGLLNSPVVSEILKIIEPTMHFSVGSIKKIPIIIEQEEIIAKKVKECIELAHSDWDSFETSWNFLKHPLVIYDDKEDINGNAKSERKNIRIEASFRLWEEITDSRFNSLKTNEEELNRIFIDIYGLNEELSPEIDDEYVTIRRANLSKDIRSFISYSVGCMFGRYSLDIPGLVYAGGEWDASKYSSFQPDEDAILPICDDEYFEDDIVGRFEKFVEVVYGKKTLEENLQFIANALGGKGSSREVIRHYFINDFYADHLKVYQKRPIYWLFDSGKKNGFKCLIYMHRYQPDTIARIRTDYVHEQQSRYRTAIAELEQRISGASTSERVKLSKQLTKLQGQAEELRVYEEKIHHLADQMIKIDLDDGVKVNYAKFQDVLAKIK